MTNAEQGVSEHEILKSPQWLPMTPSGDRQFTFVNLDEAAYRSASFLDERAFASGITTGTADADTLRSSASRISPRAYFIFHTGHVGSTLVSRLIGEHDDLFSIREPALLRTVAFNDAKSRNSGMDLMAAIALLSRTWRDTQRSVIKTTSFTNEIVERVLSANYKPMAILMFVSPLNYLRGILAGENSRAECSALAPVRLQRLTRRLEDTVSPLSIHSEGARVAMSWLCEMTALFQAARRFPRQITWVDFDRFLRQPELGLHSVVTALGAVAAPHSISTTVAGPLMRQYSKAPEHAYDAALRREVLSYADVKHGPEIRRGMKWLNDLAAINTLVAEVLEFIETTKRDF